MLQSSVPEKLAQVTAEAWEGGGFLGQAYGPIIEALEEWELPVIHHAGASAGAITAMLRAIGAPAAHVRQIQEATPWAEFAAYHPPAVLRLAFSGGWHSIDFARRWIVERLLEAGFPEDLTFHGLHRRTGHHLYVAATRYLRRGAAADAQPHVFSTEDTPEVPVADAVLASMAVPLFWPPVQVDGWWHCDGGVAMNHPLSIFSGLPCDQVLGVRLDSHREIEDAGGDVAVRPLRPRLPEILVANATMLRAVANQAFVPKELWQRIIRIDVGDESALDFRARPERIDRLRAAGAAALSSWVSTP